MKINSHKNRQVYSRVILTLALALLFVASNAPSQTLQSTPPASPAPQPTPSPSDILDDVDVVRVESNLVVVPVSVTDSTGQAILGLTKTDFRLLEEGRAQEITQIGDPEQVPLDIAILLDVSGSVDSRFSFEQQAASRFLKTVLKTGDRATVFAIDQTPRHELPLDTAENAAAKIMSIVPAKRATAFYDTLIEAVKYLAQNTPEQHRRVVVVITDGEDNFSDKVKKAIGATREAQAAVSDQAKVAVYNKILSEVQREVQKAEVTFYSINPSGGGMRLNIISSRAEDGMERLAQATGGTSFIPEKEENFEAVFRQIAAELRSQYLLQYYSPDESAGSKYLRVSVSVPARPALRVRARQGYYSKSKQ